MEYPESDAQHYSWGRDGNLSVVHHNVAPAVYPMGHFCGYCRMPRLVAESGYDGILTYVPVHGGITYARESATGQMVYGFDCGHAGDENNLWWHDPQAVLHEARKMNAAIWIASFFEPFYLLPLGNKWKARVIDAYHWVCKQFGVTFELTDNFGALLAVMSGKL